MNSFILKIIACVSMLLDHSGYVIFGEPSFLNYIGRFAFPIFAYQISLGYIHTSSKRNYLIRLLVFALISQAPFALFLGTLTTKFTFNIFFTLILGFLAILIFDKIKFKSLGILIACLLAYIGQALNVDYGAYGVMIIFMFYLFRENKFFMTSSFLIAVSVLYFNRFSLFTLFTMLAIIPILLYNKKQGKKTKYFLYVFYPVHLFILYLIAMIS